MNSIKSVIILAVLIVIIRIIGFFAGSETAYLSLSKIKMRRMVQEKQKNAKVAAGLKNNMDALLTVILIGTNFMNSLASALATSLAVAIVGAGGVGIATLVITFFVTTFGQIIPKTVAGFYAEKTACRNALPLLVLEKIFFPIVWIFSLLSRFASKLAGFFWKTNGALVTEEELHTLIDVGEKEGTLEANESSMLNKIFRFNDLDVHDIMKHRSLVQSVSIDASKSEVMAKFNDCGLKMIAVYKDTREQIVGVIHYKSVLFTSEAAVPAGVGYAAAVMKDALIVPETFTVLELLARFKKERAEFAVALDEQGSTAGVVTMDDILRIVFGRMTDEAKTNIQPASRIKLVSANEFIVPGDMKIDDVNDILKLGIESEEFTTIGGWLLEKFDYLPNSGEILKWNGNLFIVEEQAGRRILSVRIQFIASRQLLYS